MFRHAHLTKEPFDPATHLSSLSIPHTDNPFVRFLSLNLHVHWVVCQAGMLGRALPKISIYTGRNNCFQWSQTDGFNMAMPRGTNSSEALP